MQWVPWGFLKLFLNHWYVVSVTAQLSILVHPDKNQDDPDRAQKAFEGNVLNQSMNFIHFTQFVVLDDDPKTACSG